MFNLTVGIILYASLEVLKINLLKKEIFILSLISKTDLLKRRSITILFLHIKKILIFDKI